MQSKFYLYLTGGEVRYRVGKYPTPSSQIVLNPYSLFLIEVRESWCLTRKRATISSQMKAPFSHLVYITQTVQVCESPLPKELRLLSLLCRLCPTIVNPAVLERNPFKRTVISKNTDPALMWKII